VGFLTYLAGRIGVYLAVIVLGVSITFLLPRFMPRDPVDQYIGRIESLAGQTLRADEVLMLRRSMEDLYGLKGSLLSQYVRYFARLARLDFGPSLEAWPRPVAEIISVSLPWTLGLLAVSIVIAWLLGNAVGLVAGYYHNRRFSTVLEVIGVTIYPIPYYVLALTLILLFAYVIPVFPITTTINPGGLSWAKVVEIVRNSTLPACTIVLAAFGWSMLGMKALSYSTRGEAFVRYARLQGVPDGEIMTKYVMRNAILPQITALAISLGHIFNGALLTEILFSYPGMGLIIRNAAYSADYNLLCGAVAVSIVAVATAALLIDLAYPLFDPRIRLR
jgi:peptide/nickel transport system permease protein